MSMPILVRPEARDDLAEARAWYNAQQQGLGERFAASVEEFIERITTFPELYGILAKNIRCGKLRRFPYVVYYHIASDCIEVIAVLHGSRHPRVWRKRANQSRSST